MIHIKSINREKKNGGGKAVNFKVYNEDKLQLLGQDSVAIMARLLFETEKIQEFSNGLSRIDYKDELKEKIQFSQNFDNNIHPEQVLFYMVMYGATLIRYYATDYIKEKKLFGGYKENLIKVLSFSKGLEVGLDNFKARGNFINIKSINANITETSYEYSFGETLNKIPLPFFWFEYTKQTLDEITIDFATKISSIRQPKYPNIVIGVFYEKAKEIVPLSQKILTHFFIE